MNTMLKSALVAIALGATTVAAQAAPGAPIGAMKDAAPVVESKVEQVAYVRRCWWAYGKRHCRVVHRPKYVYRPYRAYRSYRAW
jgi:hypothetical protein